MRIDFKILIFLGSFLISTIALFGQGPVDKKDTLEPYIVTATRDELSLHKIPMRGSVLVPSDKSTFTNANIDDLLYQVPNTYIDRRNGIFSKNSSVSLRGLNGSTRVLILSDGVPINKTDGGGVNWNRINPETIERIEVVKGPGSSLYGFNAMGGVINLITRKPKTKNEVSASAWAGDFNSKGASMYYGHRAKADTGFYFSIDGFSRLGDGYYAQPDSTLDSTSAKLYVKDYAARFLGGYNFSKKTALEVELTHSYNESGDGTKIYDPKGAYYSYTTDNGRVLFKADKGTWGILNVLVYYQRENYLYQKENFKKAKIPPYEVTAYNLTQTNAIREDFGATAWHQLKLNEHHKITYGFEARQGSGYSSEIWFTSTDTMKTKGTLQNFGAYVQHEGSFFKNRLKWISALRYDAVNFIDGSYNIYSPSQSNELMQYYGTNYSPKSWQGFSPRTGFIWILSDQTSAFINGSAGFRPPMLDDMVNNRSITKGFKLANPALKPETVYAIEAGGSYRFKRYFVFEPSVYFMQGHDFNYFVATGDTIWGDNKPKPMLQRDNIAQVDILGAEATLRFFPWHGVSGYLNYSYNHSTISKYTRKTDNDLDLTGKFLTEVPKDMASIGITWENKIVDTHISFNYVGTTFSDDENLIQMKEYYTLNLKLSRELNKYLSIWAQGQNLTNTIYIDNKGLQSLGRFVSGGIRFNL